jgi:RNA polymerase sigma factor (sigma-70 family)
MKAWDSIHPAEPETPVRPLLFNNSDTVGKDSLIWNAFRASSREAFDFIFKQEAAHLLAYGSKFTPDHDLVLDCIQDLFVELWNRRSSLGETTSIRFYLLCALRRRIVKSLHGLQRFEAIAEEAMQLQDQINFSAEHLWLLKESEQSKRASLRRAIDGLTRRQRESIYLKFFQGLSNDAVAKVMGLSESSVSTLVSQSVKALREALR